jgi:hypothetical protein
VHSAEIVLIIIISAALSLFLIVGIVVLVLIAKLLQAVRHIVQKAEKVVDTAGNAAEMLRNASGPLAVFKVVRHIIRTVEGMRK